MDTAKVPATLANIHTDANDKRKEDKETIPKRYHNKKNHPSNKKAFVFAGGDDCPVIQSTLLDNLSIRERKALSPKDKILALAGQKDIISVEDFFTPVMIRTLTKLGEGVFGEVFNCYTSEGDGIAVKIMPIEGTEIVNDEKQKTFSEILPEMIISKELSDLGKDETSDHYTKNFVQLYKLGISKGEYPTFLVNAWDDWDEREESDNERPDKFQDNQLYAMFAFENSGSALEAFTVRK
jgi:serine/threonine-protein kinase haspin